MIKQEYIKEERNLPSYDKRCPITPWGRADFIKVLNNGIKIYSTPSHGGAFIPKKLRATMPAQFVNADGWYEEDCEFTKVVLAFPELFDSETLQHANRSWEYWFNPDGTYKDSKLG